MVKEQEEKEKTDVMKRYLSQIKYSETVALKSSSLILP